MSRVSDIMAIDVISVNVDDNLKEIANVFENIRIRHVPVMSGDALVGIVSKSDVYRMKQFCQVLDSGDKALLKELEEVLVKTLMKKPITINHDQTIQEASEILVANHFHALPVIKDLQMVGIITSTDIIKFYMN